MKKYFTTAYLIINICIQFVLLVQLQLQPEKKDKIILASLFTATYFANDIYGYIKERRKRQRID